MSHVLQRRRKQPRVCGGGHATGAERDDAGHRDRRELAGHDGGDQRDASGAVGRRADGAVAVLPGLSGRQERVHGCPFAPDLVGLSRNLCLAHPQSLTRRPGRDIPSVTLRINVSPTQAVMQAWCRTSISGGDGRRCPLDLCRQPVLHGDDLVRIARGEVDIVNDEQRLPSGPNTAVRWLHHDTAPAGETSLLEAAVRELARREDP